MGSQFFGNPWSPVRRGLAPDPKLRRKVVSIPVHFVGSEPVVELKNPDPAPAPAQARRVSEEARAAAAARVQKVFRGFLVRKNARLVRKVAAEVAEIERRVSEEWELIRGDATARARVSEMLMALLLRLDSVRGVRSFRKKVIRQVITLQEKVDSVVAGGEAPVAAQNAADADAVVQEAADFSPESNSTRSEECRGTARSKDAAEAAETPMEIVEEVAQEREAVLVGDLIEESSDLPPVDSNSMVENLTPKPYEVEEIREGRRAAKAMEIGKEMEESLKSAPAEVPADAGNPKSDAAGGERWSLVEKNAIQETDVAGDERWSLVEKNALEETGMKKGGSHGEASREVLERVAAESVRLKGLIAELCESCTQQLRLMGKLIVRVEQLEHSMIRMEKREKRRRSGSGILSSRERNRKKQQRAARG